MAADIRVEGITPEEVAKYAESIGIQRIGLYTKKSFVHIGSGTTKKFWLNSSTNVVDTFGGKPETVTLELPVLRRGMKNETVEALQVLLSAATDHDLAPDGSLGADTKKFLVTYQEKAGLKVTGECDKATWSSLLGV
jgi:peptidoglycan hydrolase-like protein with peptidoglycan-binding domain